MNIYIIEDNMHERKNIQNELHKIEKTLSTLSFSIHAIDNYIHFFESVSEFNVQDFDLFIIDIHLNSYFNGIDLAKAIRKKNEQAFIMFFTVDNTLGIKTINEKIYPHTYLVKSLDEDILYEVLKQAIKQIEQKILLVKSNSNTYLVLKQNAKKIIIPSKKIYYVETVKGTRGKLIIQTDAETFILDGKISDLKKELDTSVFFMELKSYIIGIPHIQSYNRIEGTVYFNNNSSLYIGLKPIDKLIKKVFH